MRLGICLALLWSPLVAEAGERWVVVSRAETLPSGLARQVERAGGRVERAEASGWLVVESHDAAFRERALRIGAVQAVLPDFEVALADGAVLLDAIVDDGSAPEGVDPYFPFQWGLQAVGAPAAWAAGRTGAGVRIAVMDQGLDCDHPDLVDNVEVEASASFIPGEGPCNVGPAGTHGTMVAGIAAGAANGIGTVGVAPDATIVGVKVFPQRSPSTAWSTILEGLAWLATADVDVVNMSFSMSLPIAGDEARGLSADDVREVQRITDRALRAVWRSGAVLVGSAGNQGRDRDNEDPRTIVLPADSPFVIAVSATAPIGWALDPTTDLDVPTTYTNHGVPAITVAAPGGQWRLSGSATCWLDLRCRDFDLVLAPTRTGWGWGMGTSFAAPHVAGVVALLAQDARARHPAALTGALMRWADDLGAPGRDPFFGHGRVHTGF